MRIQANWFIVLVIICATVFSFILEMFKDIGATHAKTFCAYNRVFVEFTEHGKTWGTLMLDWAGKPIPCREDSEDLPVNVKETI